MFSDQTIDGDEASGTICVLRSKLDHPLVAENRDLVPLFVVDKAGEKIKDGTIANYVYDAKQAKPVRRVV